MPSEPMWYCHECHAEMRPLMIPDPTCASCRGSFVEKIEDPTDDPREYDQPPDLGDMPGGMDVFMRALQSLAPPSRSPASSPTSRGNGISFSFSSSGGSGPRTLHIGGGRRLGDDQPPTLSEFGQRGSDGDAIGGTLMTQYLMAMLSGGLPGRQGAMPDIFSQLGGPAQSGRMGDYVFNQEALDQIITQLMESSNAHLPVPAPDETVQKLPREVLEEGSPMLEKDCAVCKDQFSLTTEDPDEQVVVTLPCHHPFHQPCIVPWLKSSGTCPVCRHALVPQPEQGSPDSTSGPSNGSGSSPSPPSSATGASRPMPGLFASLFGSGTSGSNTSSAGGSGPTNHSNNTSSDGHDTPSPPGGWH